MKFERYLIVFLIISAAVVASFFMSPIYAAALIAAISFGAILLGNPRRFLFIYIGVASIYPLLTIAFPSVLVKYLNELMGVVLYAVFVGHLAFRQIAIRDAKKFGRIALIMVGYIALTWVINRGSPRAAMQCVFSYFSFIPFYFLGLKYFKRSDFKPFLMATYVFLFVNILLNMGWFLKINPLPNAHLGTIDEAKGVFLGCNHVAYLCVMLFFPLVSLYVLKKDISPKWKVLILITIGAVMVQLYMTYTNHAYIFFGVALVPYLIITRLWKKWQVFVMGGVLVIAIAGAVVSSEELRFHFNKEQIQFRIANFRLGAKGQLLDALLVQHRKESAMEWMFGVGPGNGIGNIGKDNRTPLALEMLLPIYTRSEKDMRKQQMTSISGSTTSAVLTMWSEFGLVGFLLFCSFYVLLFGQAWRYAADEEFDLQKKIISGFLIGSLAMFLVINILMDIMGYQVYVLWLWGWAVLLNLPEGGDQKSTISVRPSYAGGQSRRS